MLGRNLLGLWSGHCPRLYNQHFQPHVHRLRNEIEFPFSGGHLDMMKRILGCITPWFHYRSLGYEGDPSPTPLLPLQQIEVNFVAPSVLSIIIDRKLKNFYWLPKSCYFISNISYLEPIPIILVEHRGSGVTLRTVFNLARTWADGRAFSSKSMMIGASAVLHVWHCAPLTP